MIIQTFCLALPASGLCENYVKFIFNSPTYCIQECSLYQRQTGQCEVLYKDYLFLFGFSSYDEGGVRSNPIKEGTAKAMGAQRLGNNGIVSQ